MKNYKSKGYTLIELLTVIAILTILFSIIAGVLYSTLRGSSKAKITSSIAQNGNTAVAIISNIIISSDNVTQFNSIDISDCTASPSGTSITLKRTEGGTTTLSCSQNTILSDGSSLIDTTEVEIDTTSIAGCYFYCTQSTNDPYSIPIVGFGFSISDKNETLFENKAKANFQNSISLRNYSP